MKRDKKLNLSKVSGGMSVNIEGDIKAQKITLIDNSQKEHIQNDQTFHKIIDIERDISILSSPLN